MSDLRLVAVDEEGTHLLLRHDEHATDLRLAIDERLHAALRGDRARLGQLEIQIDSQLRPKEIQARVRSGESVESVAQAAGVPLDHVLRFAAPVLDERRHMADRARRLAVRRPGADGPGPVPDAVIAEHMATKGGEGEPSWDAWRREDGRWAVVCAWRSAGRSRSARWVFDAAGRSVTPDDEVARGLSGERAASPRSPAVGRLAVVKDVRDVTEQSDREADQTTTRPIPTAPEEPGFVEDPVPEQPAAPAGGSRPDDGRLRLSDIARHVEMSGDEAPDLDDLAPDAPLGAAPPPAPEPCAGVSGAAARRQRARPAVPSWDEIMFGRRRRGGE